MSRCVTKCFVEYRGTWIAQVSEGFLCRRIFDYPTKLDFVVGVGWGSEIHVDVNWLVVWNIYYFPIYIYVYIYIYTYYID